MFIRRDNAGVAALTAAIAVALVGGMTTAVPAAASPYDAVGVTAASSGTGDSNGTDGTGGTDGAGAGKTAGKAHWVTLITGDRIRVGAQGRVLAVQRAEGRENVPVQIRTHKGRTQVVPLDAQRLIAEGRLDRRLFDVTELSRAESRTAHRDGLKVIVGYRGAAKSARSEVRATDDVQVRRSLASLNADAVTAPADRPGALWRTLTRERGDGARSTAAGIGRIWLDGVRRAHLNTSVGRIGAPKAWAAKLTGKGVKIAVLDTGVDGSHPDLKGRVTRAKNFTSSPDTKDRVGHGTHVASIAAGTGAKSGGTYKGVAPQAELLSGKVLDDTGSGDDSGIIAGMDWAVAQGAHIVNLSLGGWDSPGIDPMEAQINKLTAEKGVLFAVSAGNDGPWAGTIGSPGSADAALTVGAVDDKDKIAEFSSVGPRIGDGAIKPDVTAPGVDTTAASAPGSQIAKQVGEKPAGYLTISGTSMAAPHAAGAAALLKQKYKDWKADRLKKVLASSTAGGAHSAFQQGSGRIAVDKAIEQTVIAESGSISFGMQQWPHTDDKPVTEQVTYRNLSDKPVVLDLTATTVGPKGKPAPAGFFTLGQKKVTVPANGTAAVDVTADTRIGGNANGHYSATVVATAADGRTVRTAAAVERESEAYDVTVKHIARDGSPGRDFTSMLHGARGFHEMRWTDPEAGVAVVRVPKGDYLLESLSAADAADSAKGVDLLVRPKLKVDGATTVTVDARTTEPVSITGPDAGAKQSSVMTSFAVGDPWDGGASSAVVLKSSENLRTAHLGPEVADGSFVQNWNVQWRKGAGAEYNTIAGGKGKTFSTGYTRTYQAGDFAKIDVSMGGSVKNKLGETAAHGWVPTSFISAVPYHPQTLPARRAVHVATVDGAEWQLEFIQPTGYDSGLRFGDAYYVSKPRAHQAGKTYRETFNTPVFSPDLTGDSGVFRRGEELWGSVPLVADGAGHLGGTPFTSVKTTLHQGEKKIGENEDALWGEERFTLPAADAPYTLKTSVTRDPKISRVSSRIDASWTFRSKKPSGDTTAELPVSTARFGVRTALDSTAPAGRTQSVPVTVQGAAAGKNLKSLTVGVSYDNGKTWKKLTVKKGKVTVKNPAKGKGIALRAGITDKKGNKGTVTVYDAYYGT